MEDAYGKADEPLSIDFFKRRSAAYSRRDLPGPDEALGDPVYAVRRQDDQMAVPADQQAAAFPADKDTADGVERGASDIGTLFAPQRKLDPQERTRDVKGKRVSARVTYGGRP